MMHFRLNIAAAQCMVHNQNAPIYNLRAGSINRYGNRKIVDVNSQEVFPCVYFNAFIRGFKSDLKIKWVRPTKIPCTKPEKSGDLKPLPPIDTRQCPVGFDKSQELRDADDTVKKIFSLQFMPRSKSMEVVRSNFVNTVKSHALDRSSMEVRIAAMTGGIKDLQDALEKFPRNQKMKVQLKELIDKRKKFLKHLRRWDYKRFEWLLEKLDLAYRPPPDHFHWVTRKDSLRKLTDKHCEALKQERLAAYKETLEYQKLEFLKEKANKLKWIVEEERACGIEPSFNESDISQVLQQLKELEISVGISRQS